MNLPELIVANCVSINDRTDLAQIRIVKSFVSVSFLSFLHSNFQ